LSSFKNILILFLISFNVLFCTCEQGNNIDPSTQSVWTDPESGLMWQNDSSCCYKWNEAQQYCHNLNWGGYTDWRLPTIFEFRSLIRGCHKTRIGGDCMVTELCSQMKCNNASCDGCPFNEGPATDGRYLPVELMGEGYWFWSATHIDNEENAVWYVDFGFGRIIDGNINSGYGGDIINFFSALFDYSINPNDYVRCVR